MAFHGRHYGDAERVGLWPSHVVSAAFPSSRRTSQGQTPSRIPTVAQAMIIPTPRKKRRRSRSAKRLLAYLEQQALRAELAGRFIQAGLLRAEMVRIALAAQRDKVLKGLT